MSIVACGGCDDFDHCDDEQKLVNLFCKKVLNLNPVEMVGHCDITSMESTFRSLCIARNRFAATNHAVVIIYASKYCSTNLIECASILQIPLKLIEPYIGSSSMDMHALVTSILLDNNDTPKSIIVVLTMGTSQKDGYDDIEDLYENVISKLQNNHEYHIHVDATFGGMVYPFIMQGWLCRPFDTFNVSFHKCLSLGNPYPCSLMLSSVGRMSVVINDDDEGGCGGSGRFILSNSINRKAIIYINKILDNCDFIRDHTLFIHNCIKLRNDFININDRVKTNIFDQNMGLCVELLELPLELATSLSKCDIIQKKKNNSSDDNIYILFLNNATFESIDRISTILQCYYDVDDILKHIQS